MNEKWLFRKELNFRDLGGLPTSSGKRVKEGCFYRSSGLYLLNENEKKQLEQMGIKAILDLRTKEESRRKPDPELNGIKMLQHSGVVSKGGEDIDFSPKGMVKTGRDAAEQKAKLTAYYQEMPFGNQAFKVMFDEIKAGNVPLLFHCATGKDRTGVAAMLLLFALGCDDEIVFQDYIFSNECRKSFIDGSMKGHREKIAKNPELKELLQMKDGVSEKIGRDVIAEIHRRYPDLNDFFAKEYGLSQQDLQDLKDRYTE
ncbi:MAG: tyrosine-protein phosphatase [Lactimicrobium sp.]|uniref:tyrosine-protein phosphatase n=1 Tax=Lactimicrobium sp. TaxID=2563780 RepID=UPI002F35825A